MSCLQPLCAIDNTVIILEDFLNKLLRVIFGHPEGFSITGYIVIVIAFEISAKAQKGSKVPPLCGHEATIVVLSHYQ